MRHRWNWRSRSRPLFENRSEKFSNIMTANSKNFFSRMQAFRKLKTPMIDSPGFLFWRRPTDSRTPVRSPATLAGLTVYPTASQHVVFSARVGDAKTKRPAHLAMNWALCSGDVLLSHGLSPYYHRGCSVSLPCSEWERVVPLR